MEVLDFTNIFLPNIISLYVDGQLPLHSLVDIDTWSRVFPEQPDGPATQIHWKQVALTCNKLRDSTLLFTLILPQPLQKGEPKFLAIRLNPASDQPRRAVLYELCRPASIYDNWDILYLPLPEGADKKALKFKCKVDGTDSLRNFVYTVQQLPFIDQEYGKTTLDRLRDFFRNVGSTQDGASNRHAGT